MLSMSGQAFEEGRRALAGMLWINYPHLHSFLHFLIGKKQVIQTLEHLRCNRNLTLQVVIQTVSIQYVQLTQI
jgi:hypothetical protein